MSRWLIAQTQDRTTNAPIASDKFSQSEVSSENQYEGTEQEKLLNDYGKNNELSRQD